jgi:succinate-semialdehyde dehydrogenase/glutarate-semialdehyde dehydrogenase
LEFDGQNLLNRMAEVDGEPDAFFEQHFHHVLDDSQEYDLVVSCGEILPHEVARVMIVAPHSSCVDTATARPTRMRDRSFSRRSSFMKSVNPANEQLLCQYDELSDAELERRIREAGEAFTLWRRRSFAERGERMVALATSLRARQQELAELMTREMGKPIVESEAEIEKCAWVCEYYAEHAEQFLAERSEATEAATAYVRYDPLGVILAVMPWNFPFWQVFRFAAPAVMAGNTALLKHASNTQGCALAIEDLFLQAGFPQGTFATLLLSSKRISAVVRHPTVRAATLTGSEKAGATVAGEAGQHIKHTVMELGGSDPFIVLADADLQRAAQVGVKSRMINSGQSCIAAKRFIVERSAMDEFRERFLQQMQELHVGDPLSRDTDVGPQAREDLCETLQSQVDSSVADGAKLLLGGQRLDRRGYYYPPTLLDGVRPGMPVVDEEVFGPVAALMEAEDHDDAIRLANCSEFGLGASLWTHDFERARGLVGEIDAGCVFVNELVKSDPRMPFGGVKKSGYGRELSREGIREFVNIKTVWMQ